MSQDDRPIVLVVDDDEPGRELVRRKLEKAYRVITAANGAEALECVASDEVDLVVLDVMMPGMDGYTACRRIKESSGDGFLPVILLTALQGQDDINRGLAAGADEFLTKPIDTRELRLRASALLRIRSQE
ncbi:MAG: response regulator, partial [Planctomycetota bacterium]|nr:response regulator [Planctomycetota bacterium]